MAVILTKSGNLEYLIAEDLTVPHCFTTRLGGVSRDHLSSMNIAHHRGDEPEKVRVVLMYMVSPDGMNILRYDVLDYTHDGVFASDHWPLVLTVRFD